MTIVVFDFETTGVKPLVDRPCQVAAIDQNYRILINTLCDPCTAISEGAAKVHGITSEDVRYSPAYTTAIWQMLCTIGPGNVLAGYNISMFDLPMLRAAVEPWFEYQVLDVLDVVYRRRPQLPSKKLGDVHQALLGQELIGAHGAVQDCIGSLRILNHICEKDGVNYQELVDEQKVARPYKTMPIGKHAGMPVGEVPAGWAQWMRQNARDLRPDLRATIDLILEK